MVNLVSLCGFLFGLILLVEIELTVGQYNVMDLTDCVFPFEINGEKHDSCVYLDKKYPWCSLTKSFKGVWKYCNDMTKTNWTCATACATSATDKYPSCRTDGNQRMYCLNEILDLSAKPVGKCDKKYKEVSTYHTACLPPQPYVAKTGISDEDKTLILDLHNNWRRNVAVPAAGMPKMYWDNTLQMLAQRHAERCSFAHDDMDWRSIPETGKETGQNIVMITGPKTYNWTTVFNEMFAGESKRWRYKEGIKKEFEGKHALHYTQIIMDQISILGCGYAECVYVDRIEKAFVCNYDQLQSLPETKIPYKEGKEFCELCPDRCENKLCDCKGKQCYNKGVLNLNTCQCECTGFWKGSDCSIPIVPVENDLGCMIPFMYEDKLHYKCVYDVIDGYFCSKTPYYTGNVEYCEDEHFDESLLQKREEEPRAFGLNRRHSSNNTIANLIHKLFPGLALSHTN